MTDTAVIVGFRDRGRDPLRQANLDTVLAMWRSYGHEPIVTDDGQTGDAQWNRHRAYNRGAQSTDADVLVYAESDMLIDLDQIDTAIEWATASPGLVVPFTERHEHNPVDSERIRLGADYRQFRAAIVKPKPRRTGAINVITRQTYDLVGGYDEAFNGSHWDDRSMHIAFDVCAGPTRWINGPSHHLHHLPGYTGQHLTPEDKAATAANRHRYQLYRQARTAEQIRELTSGAR